MEMRESHRNLSVDRSINHNLTGSQLPARSMRLLNRTRLQPTLNGLDSPRSIDKLNLINYKYDLGRDSANGSPDEQLFMLDKTLRNSMIQDVQYFKQQLLQLRSILQETNSLNPLDCNGKFFDCTIDIDDKNADGIERDNYSPSLSDDPKHDLVDLRRQVVYLQSQLDDKDRTIRIQQNLISKLEAEVNQGNVAKTNVQSDQIDTVNTATQTDRVRPLSMNFDGSNSNRGEDEMRLSIASSPSVSSSSSSLSSTKSPKRNLSSSIIGKKMLFENNGTKDDQSNRAKWISSKNDSIRSQTYFRNIVANSSNEQSKLSTESNDLNVQINNRTSIKSMKLLNNLNAMKFN